MLIDTNPANNQDLFYQFQGLTRDRTYYVIAIFPIITPGLEDSNAPANAVPIDVFFHGMGDPNADGDGYFAAVDHYLNTLPSEAFTPTLSQLDALVQSMEITP